ncbi:MAG: FKBP-type peptidyl-prolyl cis-trans isomerase [Bacteroidota bacterium]
MRRLLFVLPLLLLALPACDSNEDDVCSINTENADAVATATSNVRVAYVGTLADGTVFDSNDCIAFGLSGTIRGFRNNIAGMRVGETKTFDVPPEDGYGANPPPGIPPNATLTFEVTLLDVLG